MALQLTGNICTILDSESGQGKNGEWKKQVFIIETTDQYPKKIAFTAWNTAVETIGRMREGQQVTVSFNPESREYNGKWYTDLKAWKIEGIEGQQRTTPPKEQETSKPFEHDGKDDLPF